MNLSSPATVAALMRRHGLKPQKRLGQNFLVDANVLNHIVDASGLESGGQAFEVGPGLGVLTHALAERVGPDGRVVAVELDRHLEPALAETLADQPQAYVEFGDALAIDLDALFRDRFDQTKPVAAVANIPYQITSPLIARLFEHKSRLSSLTLLVQREVAQRLAAKPATDDYGAFTLFCQYHAKVEMLFTVPRTVFCPPPEVTSAVLRLTPHATPPVTVPDEAQLFAVIKAAFGQRRKTIANALANDPSLGWPRDKVAAALDAAGIEPSRRGETVSLDEFARLAS